MSSGNTGIGEPVGPETTDSLWTARRRRLQDALAKRDELFGDLYGRAIDALDERPLRRGSLVIAGHCIRDLVNGLPDVLDDVGLVPEHSDVGIPARELSNLWNQHQNVLGPVDSAAETDAKLSTDKLATVPADLIHTARKIVATYRAGVHNGNRRYSALVIGRVEAGTDPTVKLFRRSVSTFERLRHPQRGRDVTVTDDTLQKLVTNLEIIERALEGRLGSFFEAMEDLMDIIEAANTRDGAEDNE